MVSVHLTDFCNSKCDFCVVNSPLRQRPIATDKLTDFVRSFAGKEVDILNLHGGEPTISKALFPVIEAGRAAGIQEVHVQTNGIKLADRSLVERLMENGVKVFVISLHGHTSELQEEITLSPGSFDNIVRAIQNCLSAGALVRTNTVVCRQNIDQIYEVLALSCELGVPWQNISALHPSEHAQRLFTTLVPHPQETREKLPAALRRLEQDFPDVFFELEGFATCHVPGYEARHIKKNLRDIQLKYHDVVIDDYERFMDVSERMLLTECLTCSHAESCNGIYKPYMIEFERPLVWPRRGA